MLLVAACGGDGAPAHAVPGERGPAILVEVLNATGQPGHARVGTRILRRAGIDVVYFGNAPGAIGGERGEGGEGGGSLDSTRIVVRRGTTAAAERVRRALGVGRIVVELDSTRLLDASVFLGDDFRPREGFHP